MARITIYFGHYGSGKTELSLSKAFFMAEKGNDVTLVDLDIVNPYFRSGEQKKALEEKGIKVIMPNFEGTNVAVPSLPAEINTVFIEKDRRVVFDVGGSPSGATAIGRYSSKIKEDEFETCLVVNVLRPFTTTAQEIEEIAKDISLKSRLPIHSLINNTNVAYETTPEMVEEGQKVVEEAAKLLGVEVSKIYVLKEVISRLSSKFIGKYKDILEPIELRMRPSWLDSTD
jgi:energy-coupling factor transporter ATP-binding protein EcfA2